MTAHSESFPHGPAPYQRTSRVRIPGRGRITSGLLAIGIILALVVIGVFIVFTYMQAVEDAPNQATEDGYIVQPMVDMSK